MNEAGNVEDISAEAVPRFADHSVKNGTWGYTYFVQLGDLIKIGHSGAPKQRIGGLGQPRNVLAVIPNTIISEADAHKKFAHLRERNELFRIAPDLLDFIEWAKQEAAEIPKRPVVNNMEFEDTRRRIIAMRQMIGAKSQRGYACSNLIEQIKHYRTATGEQKANLAKGIAAQLETLSGKQPLRAAGG